MTVCIHLVLFSFLLILLSAVIPAEAARNKDPRPVVIIGAGVAGAKVAYELARHNVSFVILEATAQAGGRLRRQRLSPSGPLLEIGGNWVQGFRRGEPYSDLVADVIKIQGPRTNYDDAYFVQNGRLVPDEIANPVWARVEAAIAKLYAFQKTTVTPDGRRKFDMSIKAALLAAAGWEANSPIERAAMSFSIDFEYADAGGLVSVHQLTPFADPTGPERYDFFVTDPRGFRAFVNWHLHQAGVRQLGRSSRKLHLRSPVRKIEYGSSGVNITLRNGKKWEARAAVSTVSIGVLQEALFDNPKEKSRIIFRPPLPMDKRIAISKCELADYLKMFIQFRTEIFKSSDPLFLFPLECAEGGWINIMNLNKPRHYPGQNIVLLTAVGPFSRDVVCMSRKRQLREALSFVSLAVGRKVMPWEVKAVLLPDLRNNEFFKGSYTAKSPGFNLEDLAAFDRPLDTLFFAGEAHSPKLNGYVEGAWESGAKTSKDVLKFLLKD